MAETLDYNKILHFTVRLGHALARNGAETFRSEDSCRRVLQASGVKDLEIFVLANYLTISFKDPEGQEYHSQKRIYNRADNLRRLDLLNDLARHYCLHELSADEALLRLDQIIAEPGYTILQQLFITAYVGMGFSLLLGVSLMGGLFAFVINFLLRIVLLPLQKRNVNKVFINIFGAMFVTFMAVPCVHFGLGHEMSRIVAGCSMYLFPGISLMNSIRDIIASDYLAGFTRLLETFLVAISIAIGSGLALSLIRYF